MDGIFCKQRFLKLQNVLGLVAGVFLALLFGFFILMGAYETVDDRLASWFFVIFGLLVAILCGVSLYVNKRLFLHVDEDRITGFCQFGLALDCALSDVAEVSYGGTGLNIRLKSGKKYNLMNLENAYELGRCIQKRISMEKPLPETDKGSLLVQLPHIRKRRMVAGIGLIVCFAWIFASIFVSSGLTGWRELHEFNSQDWCVFAIVGATGVIALVALGILLRKYLLDTEKQNKLQAQLYQLTLRTTPLLPGNAIKLFIDDDLYASVRLTVFGYPNSDEVYFNVEEVDRNYEIRCVYTSKVYADLDELAPQLGDMTEIALP